MGTIHIAGVVALLCIHIAGVVALLCIHIAGVVALLCELGANGNYGVDLVRAIAFNLFIL